MCSAIAFCFKFLFFSLYLITCILHKLFKCYFLPLSDCQATIGGYAKYTATKPQTKQDVTDYQWLRIYAARPRQHVRQRVYEYITQIQGLPPLPWHHLHNNNTGCTAMHVRRGDSGFVVFPWRRWAAVQGRSCNRAIVGYRGFFLSLLLLISWMRLTSFSCSLYDSVPHPPGVCSYQS